LRAHKADLNIVVDEHMKGHEIVFSDRPDQRLTPTCWHGLRLADVHDSRWSKALPPCGWRVGIHQCLGVEPKMVDGINVEQLIPMPTGPDPPLSALRGWVGEKRLVVVELSCE
jgi:hypothetical protein